MDLSEIRWPTCLFGAFILGLIISSAGAGIEQIRYRDLETTTGVVISQHTDWKPKSNSFNRYLYILRIVYSYSVDNDDYTNDQMYLSETNTYSNSWLIREFNYPVGKVVTVYYDPDNPQFSVLKKGIPPWRVTIMSIFAGLIIIGSLIKYKSNH